MTKNRLEAFSDGVIAIIITVMVLELKTPHDYTFAALGQVWPEIGSYILSFVMAGIYWNNHHHMFQAVTRISGSVMWANNHLLFWLSIMPFATAWMRDGCFVGPPVAFFGFILLMAGVAYFILVQTLIRANGKDSPMAKAVESDFKGKASVVLYAIAIAIYYYAPYVSCAIYVAVAVIWFIPDRRFSKVEVLEAEE